MFGLTAARAIAKKLPLKQCNVFGSSIVTAGTRAQLSSHLYIVRSFMEFGNIWTTMCSSAHNTHLILRCHGSLYQQSLCKSSKHDEPDTTGLPEVNDADIEEAAVLGSGPGGQAVNKTHNACQLRHIPTGIVVKSHYTRSYPLNRQRALVLLRQKLDVHYHGESGVMATAKREASRDRAERRHKSRERHEKVRAFKERLRTINSDTVDKI